MMGESLRMALYLESLREETFDIPTHKDEKGMQVTEKVPKCIIMHVPTHVTGLLVKVYRSGEYVSPVNNLPVTSCVIELDGGGTFSFDGDAPVDVFNGIFHRLTMAEAHYLLTVIGTVDSVICGSAKLGPAMKLSFDVGKMLTCAALERALRALKTSPEPAMAG